MTAEEHGVCIECGSRTPLRLPRRFPHICTECLFPPPPPDVDSHEDEIPESAGPKPSLVHMLHQRARLAPFHDRFGRDYFKRNHDDKHSGNV